MSNFPPNPIHGDIYEYKAGLLYQYDAGVNGWIPIMSNSAILDLATPTKDGAMSSLDLQKLNRLVLPYPKSSIIGNDCDFPFRRGTIDLSSGDDFINIEGQVKLRNIDEFGDDIETVEDFHIHQHTFGFDFTLDLPNLVQELVRLGQIKLAGDPGLKGNKGPKGENGINVIMAGPPGDKGPDGDAPECTLSVDTEPVSANPRIGLDKAFVDVRIKDHPTDRRKYYLEFDRQSIGNDERAADKLNVEDFGSYWVMAVANANAGRQSVYFLDVEPIINAIKEKFMEQVELLKAGYESITKHWVQTMSDLFDEQKAALCCALENCISKTKSIDTRRHMESTAASVIPDGKIKINIFPPSGLPEGDAKVVSNTRLTPGNDCYVDPTSTAPRNVVATITDIVGSVANANITFINPANSTDSTASGAISYEYSYDGGTSWAASNNFRQQCTDQAAAEGVQPTSNCAATVSVPYDGRNKVFIRVGFTSNGAVEYSKPVELVNPLSSATFKQSINSNDVVLLDASANVASVANAAKIDLPSGKYTLIINEMSVRIAGQYGSVIRVQHLYQGVKKVSTFLDKGRYEKLSDAKDAYEGLSLSVNHDGGEIALYMPSFIAKEMSGTAKVEIIRDSDSTHSIEYNESNLAMIAGEKEGFYCTMSGSHLNWYRMGWEQGKCCGMVVNISGQDYIIVKRGIGNDEACGGGETDTTPCIAECKKTLKEHPAFAWPTFDGVHFSPIPSSDHISFMYDEEMNLTVQEKMGLNEYKSAKGQPNTYRHLAYQFSLILFPTINNG